MLATTNTRTKLRQLREELSNPRVSQEALARRVGISLQWYGQLENGIATQTSWTTANAILKAVNAERTARDLEMVNLEDLELKIV